MKKIITSSLFLGAVVALASYPVIASNYSNNINNVDFSLNEENNSKNRIKQVSLGFAHSAAITTDNEGKDHLYAWGANGFGQLGTGAKYGILEPHQELIPQEVDINQNGIFGNEGTIKQVSLGRYHSAAITNDGTNDHLYTWGANNDGQLGLGTTDEKNTPQEVDINGNGKLGDEGTIKQVSLGHDHSAAITTDNKGKDHLYTWGRSESGELGLGTKDYQTTPQEVDINGNGKLGDEGTIKQVSLGWYHSSVITNDGKNDHLYTWGWNWSGQLGLGEVGYQTTPQEVNIIENGTIKQASIGGFNSAVITNDGKNDHLYIWGNNNYGQLGLGITESKNTPQEVDINGNGKLGDEGTLNQVSIGGQHSSVITTDDEGNDHLYTWGRNSSGQLGLGVQTIHLQFIPQEVDINGNGWTGDEGTIKQVFLGDFYSAVITNDGTNDHLYTWGNNNYGQLGLGTKDYQITPQEVDIN